MVMPKDDAVGSCEDCPSKDFPRVDCYAAHVSNRHAFVANDFPANVQVDGIESFAVILVADVLEENPSSVGTR